MIIDKLANAEKYHALDKRITEALHYLTTTDLNTLPIGKHIIDGENLFAIVQEYETLDRINEQMEAHRKHIDVQYVISGSEKVGHAFLTNQKISRAYDDVHDYLLVNDEPDFYTVMNTGTFMVFYPTDLHMPCLHNENRCHVKKVVVKVRVG